MKLAIREKYQGTQHEWSILRNGEEVRTETCTAKRIHDLISDLNKSDAIYTAELA